MDSPPPVQPVRINRWLPYWAVLQADVQMTLRNWVYRAWVAVSLLAAVGFLLYRVGVLREAGIIQFASTWVSDLLRWTVVGSATLIVVLTAGTISSERGTMADSVLSRGISRYQYFCGKLHARLFTVLSTFLVLGGLVIASGLIMLQDDLKINGCLVALLTVAALLTTVITCGVAISAVANSTVVGIALVWILLYGSGFVLTLVPAGQPLMERMVHNLPNILRGYYDLDAQLRLVGWSVLASGLVAIAGMVYFSRRDV